VAKVGGQRAPEHLIKIDRSIWSCDMGCMAMGKKGDTQDGLFVAYHQMRSAGHPFYRALDAVLREHGFDRYVEKLCARFYHPVTGRPGLAPGNYFRSLLVGYFEGIDSERGIAWRLGDSLSLRDFLGLPTGKAPPDHSTISRTRRLIDNETHQEVFTWVLGLLSKEDLLKGKTIGVDGTTLEANAALRSIVRRDDFRGYAEYLTDLAKASGIPTPTREDLARIDRKRKKKGSNEEWVNPHDPDAQITKMKDGSTHLGHKQEHAVDMDSGAVVAVTLHGGVAGDTATIEKTLDAADENLKKAREIGDKSKTRESAEETVGDKGYHSKAVILALDLAGRRSYISEPLRPRQHWDGEEADRDAVYANRRRKKGVRGQRLMRKRGELIERSFAHTLETGGMRRTHLRFHYNIAKRVLIHVAGFNLGLLMRKRFGIGTPRGLQGRLAAAIAACVALLDVIYELLPGIGCSESAEQRAEINSTWRTPELVAA
jgi:transposase